MATRRKDTLEVVYIDVQVRDADLKKNLQGVGRVAQTEARKLGEGFTREATPGLNGAATAARALRDRQKELDTEVNRLSLSVRNQRNAYVQGRVSQDEYERTTRSLKTEINALLDGTNDLSLAQQTKLNTSAATAERALATLRGEASRLGLAQQVQIGLTNTFGNQLRSLGPAGAAAASSLGFLAGGFTALRTPLDASTFSLERFTALAARAPQVIALATAAVGTLAIAGLTRLANEAARVADEIDKASASVGLAAEEYQELSFAFSQLGLDSDRFRTALGNLNTRLGEAIDGNERYRTTLARLGVDLNEVVEGTVGVGDVLSQVADGIAALPTTAEQAAAAATLFGRSIGNQLLPALQQGSSAIDALRQRARDLGLVISGDAILSLVEYADEVAALGQQFRTARVEIAAAFLPVLRDVLIPLLQNTLVPLLQNVARRVGDFARAFTDAGPAGQEFRENIARSIAPLVALGQVAITTGAAVVGSLQTIAGGAAQLGAFLGTLIAQTETAIARLSRISPLLADLTNPARAFGAARELQQLFDAGLFATPFDLDAARRAGQEAGQGYYEAALSSFETAGRAFTFDLTEFLEGLSREAASAVAGGAGNLFGGAAEAAGEAGSDAGRQFVEGSIALLRQRRSEAVAAFDEAGDDAGRAFAQALIDEIDEAIEAIQRRFRTLTIPVPTPQLISTAPVPVPTVSARVRPREELQEEATARNRAALAAQLATASTNAFVVSLDDLGRAGREAAVRAQSLVQVPLVPDGVVRRLAEDAERRFLEARFAAAAEIGAQVARGGGPTGLPPASGDSQRTGLQGIEFLLADTVQALIDADAPLTDIVTAIGRLAQVSPDAARAFDDIVVAFNTARSEATRIVRSQAALRLEEDALQSVAPSDASPAALARARALAQLEQAEAQLDRVRASAIATLDQTRLPSQNLIDALRDLGDEFEGLGVLDSAEEVRELADAISQLETSARDAAERDAANRRAREANQALVQSINQGALATNQFAQAIQNLASGDAGGGVGGLFGVASSIAQFFGPQGQIFGAIFSGIGSLISTLFGGRSRREGAESTRAAGAAARGAPAIQIQFQQFNSATFESLGDPRLQQLVNDIGAQTLDVLERVVLPRLGALEERLA